MQAGGRTADGVALRLGQAQQQQALWGAAHVRRGQSVGGSRAHALGWGGWRWPPPGRPAGCQNGEKAFGAVCTKKQRPLGGAAATFCSSAGLAYARWAPTARAGAPTGPKRAPTRWGLRALGGPLPQAAAAVGQARRQQQRSAPVDGGCGGALLRAGASAARSAHLGLGLQKAGCQ